MRLPCLVEVHGSGKSTKYHILPCPKKLLKQWKTAFESMPETVPEDARVFFAMVLGADPENPLTGDMLSMGMAWVALHKYLGLEVKCTFYQYYESLAKAMGGKVIFRVMEEESKGNDDEA